VAESELLDDGHAETAEPVGMVGPPAPVLAEGGGVQVPLVRRIELLLTQDPSRTWTPEQVRRALGVEAASVHSALSRLAGRRRVLRVGPGNYRAHSAG